MSDRIPYELRCSYALVGEGKCTITVGGYEGAGVNRSKMFLCTELVGTPEERVVIAHRGDERLFDATLPPGPSPARIPLAVPVVFAPGDQIEVDTKTRISLSGLYVFERMLRPEAYELFAQLWKLRSIAADLGESGHEDIARRIGAINGELAVLVEELDQ